MQPPRLRRGGSRGSLLKLARVFAFARGGVPGAHEVNRPAPRFQIERAPKGYRVVGPGLLIWEPTVGEAQECRDELEMPGWRYPLAPPIGGESTLPYESIVYGPIRSRRLGRSLGVNLTPAGSRVCSYECVYCSYAKSGERPRGARWPTPPQVADALARALAAVGPLDSINISGHGEPTLHPRLGEVIDAVLDVAHRTEPRVCVRILTNGSRVGLPTVRNALDRLDERIVKLDADPERVSRPGPRDPLGAMLLGLALLKDVTLQSCFIRGAVSNTGSRAVRDWVDLVAEIRPRAVQIYTIDRQPAGADVRPVAAEQLEEIACLLRARTGIEARTYG